jgi:hypothetical protein
MANLSLGELSHAEADIDPAHVTFLVVLMKMDMYLTL